MPGAAVRLGDRRPEEAELGHLREDLAMDLALLVPLADVRQDLGLGEGADAVADELVLVGEGEVDHGRACYAAGRAASRVRRRSQPIHSGDGHRPAT